MDDDAAKELAGLARVVDGQRVFTEVVRDYLRRITYGGRRLDGKTFANGSVRPTTQPSDSTRPISWPNAITSRACRASPGCEEPSTRRPLTAASRHRLAHGDMDD